MDQGYMLTLKGLNVPKWDSLRFKQMNQQINGTLLLKNW